MRRWLGLIGLGLIGAGGFAAYTFAVGETTGTVSACATVTSPAQTVFIHRGTTQTSIGPVPRVSA